MALVASERAKDPARGIKKLSRSGPQSTAARQLEHPVEIRSARTKELLQAMADADARSAAEAELREAAAAEEPAAEVIRAVCGSSIPDGQRKQAAPATAEPAGQRKLAAPIVFEKVEPTEVVDEPEGGWGELSAFKEAYRLVEQDHRP